MELKPTLIQLYRKEYLLTVVGQHLAAGFGQLRTILLKARQNDEVALIHQRAAKTRDIARARFLLIGRATALLGDGAGRNRNGQQRERKEKFSHCVLSF
jgi:hypothetical protein